MKKIQLLGKVLPATALLVIMTGCCKDDKVSVAFRPETERQGETTTLVANCDMPETKVVYAEGEGKLDVFWKTNDAFRLYDGETAPTGNFTLAAEDNGKKFGKFEGTAKDGTFNAFFPALAENSVWSALNVSYEGQQQDGPGTTAHLAKYDYMTAKSVVIAGNQPDAGLYFAHLGSVMQFDITLPDGYKPEVDGQPTEITLAAPGMTKSVKPSGGAGDATSSLSLKLTNIALTSSSKAFTAYMMCAPFTIPANSSLKITLLCKAVNAEGNVTRTFYEFDKHYTDGKAYVAGKRYQFTGLGTTNVFAPRKTITIKGNDFNFVLVRGGLFQMGNVNGFDADKPIHWVRITKDYYISQTEITQAQWKAVMGDSPSFYDGAADPDNPGRATPAGEIQEDRPVESVSWNDICVNNSEDGYYAICFLNQIKSVVPGNPVFNLPTEAQWEYAARGGHKGDPSNYMQWAGTNDEDQLKNFAWYQSSDGGDANGATHSVKGKKPNQLGLYDMSGNILEWCRDKWIWGESYTEAPDENNPLVDPYVMTGDGYIFRGGDSFEGADLCSSGFRNSTMGDYRGSDTGFRLILIP